MKTLFVLLAFCLVYAHTATNVIDMQNYCGNTIFVYDAIILKADHTNQLFTRCGLRFEGRDPNSTLISLQLVVLSLNISCPNHVIQISDGFRYDQECSQTGESLFKSTSYVITFDYRVLGGGGNADGNFKAVFTKVKNGACRPGEFKCNNLNCINSTLVCDKINNCGDNSDEANCHKRSKFFREIQNN